MSPILVSRALLAAIPALLWDWEFERVCIIVGQGAENREIRVEQLWKAENRHHDPMNHFALLHAQWDGFKRQAAHLGLQVLGIGHSHPYGHLQGPSSDDLRLAGRRIANFVYHSETSQVFWYRKTGMFRVDQLPLPRRYALLRSVHRLLDRYEMA